ncbi:MAG: hypothetical protein M3134_08980 [Actinomycetota bacterium]|nr:hypothetical protein [Actinomycetota bacterium]
MAGKPDLWNPAGMSKQERDKVGNGIRNEYRWLDSEIENLYREFDKLTKKSPAIQITNLALQNVNAAISDAKAFLSGDKSVDRITEFVAAGENPVNSDVLLVLSKLRAALRRLEATWARFWGPL